MDMFKKLNFKLNIAHYINITKIDDKLTFKLLKMSKQVTITCLKLSTIIKGHH